MLTRRFAHADDEKFPPLPDLLLIDGGRGHVHAALAAMAAAGVSLPVLGMVKDDHHRTRALITADGDELGIRQSPHIFTMIGRIQEEVHRFAISFQRQKHRKRTYRSKLDGIPGIGEARRQTLLKRFGTIKAIESATLSELQTVLPANAARAVYDRFHQLTAPQ